MTKTLPDFWTNITIVDGHWLWNGPIHKKGYGIRTVNGIAKPAHRIAYEMYNNKVLLLSVDVHHLCKVKRCICPLHTEEVPHDNHPESASGGNKTKTHCVNGHEFTKENTYLRQIGNGKFHRMCKTCCRNRMRKV